MDSDNASGNIGGIEVEVGLRFHSIVDFDRRLLRKSFRQAGGVVRKEARRIISRRAISKAGEAPGMDTGLMRRAVGIVSRGSKGGWIKIGIKSIPGHDFYPAFLYYGSPKTGLAKRGNFMLQALDNKREDVRNIIRDALKDSLKPR